MYTEILKKEWVLATMITLFALFIHWQSFSLHFDGDSYSNLYNYNFEVSKARENDKGISSFFLSDYGPQEIYFGFLHQIFGMKPIYFYVISFFLRLIAAWTIFPIIKALTKDKLLSYFAVLFFATAYTGIETTDWVFNMPSFVSIIFINLAITIFVNNKPLAHTKKFFTILLFLLLATINQPVRSMFLLPVFGVLNFIYLFFAKKDKSTFSIKAAFWSLLRIVLPFIVLYTLLLYSRIGENIGIVSVNSDNVFGRVLTSDNSLIVNLLTSIQSFKALINPIGQIGEIMLPTHLIIRKFEIIKNTFELNIATLFFTLLSFVGFSLTKNSYARSSKNKWYLFLTSVVWIAYLNIALFSKDKLPINTAIFFDYFVGGFFVLMLINLFLIEKENNKRFVLLFLTIFFIASYITPLIRDPNVLLKSNSRYLIIATLASSYLLTYVIPKLFKNYNFGMLVISLVILFQSVATYKFYSNLKPLRSYQLAERIRTTIPYNEKLANKNYDNPIIYLIEGDNPEMVYHVLYFGFPFFIMQNQPVSSPWKIAYTTNYNDIRLAFKDGSSLLKFGTIKAQPVDINDIYALRIDTDRNLVDESQTVRNKLLFESSQTK